VDERVMSMKGDGGMMAVADAVAMVRASPPEDRSIEPEVEIHIKGWGRVCERTVRAPRD
jgi:hypothetical protein